MKIAYQDLCRHQSCRDARIDTYLFFQASVAVSALPSEVSGMSVKDKKNKKKGGKVLITNQLPIPDKTSQETNVAKENTSQEVGIAFCKIELACFCLLFFIVQI